LQTGHTRMSSSSWEIMLAFYSRGIVPKVCVFSARTTRIA
jgi:hypothetical protein